MKIKLSILSLVLLIACSNPKQEETVSNTAKKIMPELTVGPNISKILKKINGNESGLLRGVNFGDEISSIVAKENLEQFEDKKTHVGFTFDTPEMETVDILYMKDDKEKLKEVQIDIYLNSEEDASEMLKAYTQYLTAKYGESTTQIGLPTWETDDVTVKVKMIKNKIDKGLQVFYTP